MPTPRQRLGTTHRLPPRAAAAVLTAAAGFGVVTDLALRRAPASVATAAGGAVAPLALAALVRPVRRDARALLVSASAVAPWLAWRSSPWLVWLDIALVCMLALAGLARARESGGGGLDRFTQVAAALGRSVRQWCGGAWWGWTLARSVAAAAPVPGWPAARRAVVRAARVVPLIAVVLVLLASGDALFASWFRVPVAPATVAGHLFLVLLGAASFAGLHHAAQPSATAPLVTVPSADRNPAAGGAPARYGNEVLLALGGLAVCLGAFGVTQVVASSAGRAYVLQRTGLTYADYARRGFFQLLAVACLSLATLLVARRCWPVGAAGRPRRWCVTLGLLVATETLGLVAVSLRRLALYEHEYGLTMLRLYSTVFAWWLGAVVVAAAAAVVVRRQHWLVPAVCLSAVGGVLAMNVVNPEAVVVHSQMTLARRTGRIDTVHLLGLSADAAPAIADAVRVVDERDRAAAVAVWVTWCGEDGRRQPVRPDRDWLAANRARAEARRLRAAACR